MPLAEPPAPAVLSRLPAHRVAGTTLHRVVRRERATPWWFASVPDGEAEAGGRFDLVHPFGACYLATSALAAVLEALQDFGQGLLPDAELQARALATVEAPSGAPPAAALAVARARGAGVTAALWAGEDRALTQRWAEALFRAGWRALFHGIAHDPEGRLRAVTLLDRAGEHLPLDDGGWSATVRPLGGDGALVAGLQRYGITVARTDVQPVFVTLGDSGLVDEPVDPATPAPGRGRAGSRPRTRR
jgi:hypothetical protein